MDKKHFTKCELLYVYPLSGAAPDFSSNVCGKNFSLLAAFFIPRATRKVHTLRKTQVEIANYSIGNCYHNIMIDLKDDGNQ